jgi:molybdenum cofactor cytidylyltransferase
MLDGRPIMDHALARARQSGAARIIMVVPSIGGRIGRAMGHRRGVTRVVARRHRDGLSASLQAGLAALRPIEREIFIFLADMPLAAPPRGMRLTPGYDAVRPVYADQPGHPMLVRAAAARAIRLKGDQGLAAKLSTVGLVRGTIGNLTDIDTHAALRRARRGFRYIDR